MMLRKNRFQVAALISIILFMAFIASIAFFLITANYQLFLIHASFFGLLTFLILYSTANDAPYVPTPMNIVRAMLKFAEVGPDDVVYDLGCGDGRILFTAVEEFEVAKAVGYELHSPNCDSIKLMVEKKGLKNRIEVVNENFLLADLSSASVITLYLSVLGNSKLRPKMEIELKPGTRVVSHEFPIHDWVTMKPDAPEYYAVGSHEIYVYKVPEAYDRKKTI